MALLHSRIESELIQFHTCLQQALPRQVSPETGKWRLIRGSLSKGGVCYRAPFPAKKGNNPAGAASWHRRWSEVISFFAFSPDVRKIIYATNAIESLHSQVRKAIRNKGHFTSDEAATKLIYLPLRNIQAKRKRPPKEWLAARTQLAIQFGDRFAVSA